MINYQNERAASELRPRWCRRVLQTPADAMSPITASSTLIYPKVAEYTPSHA